VISQRELRNDNAAIMRAVEEGETFTVTRRGVPVAHLVPFSPHLDLQCDRPAKTQPRYANQERVSASTPTDEVLTDLRGDR
jgi:prevent-host-death family protein